MQLASPAIAALALARSGEPAVGLAVSPSDGVHDDNDDNDDAAQDEYAITVCDVTPDILRNIENTFVDTAFYGKALLLVEMRHETLQDLHPAVYPILQRNLQQAKHKSSRIATTTSHKIHIPGLKDVDWEVPNHDNENDCSDNLDAASRSRTRLENLLDELQYHLPWVDLSFDASSFDPKGHLTRTAVQVLQTKLDKWKHWQVQQFRKGKM